MEEVEVKIISSPGSANFKKIYNLYSKVFVLKSQRESFRGFEKILGFNSNKKLLGKYGEFEETWIGFFHKGKVVGAINFSTYSMPSEIYKKYGVKGTSQIIYIFVDGKYREHGIGSELLKEAENYSKSFVDGKVVVFCEDNNPLLMTIKEYFDDNKIVGFDQCDRLIWWANHGYKRIDFDYVQPPLNQRAEICHILSLSVKFSAKEISSEIVLEHLRRFFELSILKEKNLRNYSYVEEKHGLHEKRKLKLVGSKKEYLKLKKNIYALKDKIGKKDFGKKIGELVK